MLAQEPDIGQYLLFQAFPNLWSAIADPPALRLGDEIHSWIDRLHTLKILPKTLELHPSGFW